MLLDLKDRKARKQDELLDDAMVEEMLRKAIEEAHRRIIINLESERTMQKMDFTKALNEAKNEITNLKGKIDKEKEIPKSK